MAHSGDKHFKMYHEPVMAQRSLIAEDMAKDWEQAISRLEQVAGGAAKHAHWLDSCALGEDVLAHFKRTLDTVDIGQIKRYKEAAQKASARCVLECTSDTIQLSHLYDIVSSIDPVSLLQHCLCIRSRNSRASRGPQHMGGPRAAGADGLPA